MGLKAHFASGQTPIDEEEKEGLRIPIITTREALDEFEQLNIEKAVEFYLLRRSFTMQKILTESFVLGVHKMMFSDVWKWSGTVRKSNKNIGVDAIHILPCLHQLLGNCSYWIAKKMFSDEEIAVRFKHKLVSIHIFPNGNGRHSRLMADIVMKHIFGKPRFTWGQQEKTYKRNVRDTYIEALRQADNGNFQDLIAFSMQ